MGNYYRNILMLKNSINKYLEDRIKKKNTSIFNNYTMLKYYGNFNTKYEIKRRKISIVEYFLISPKVWFHWLNNEIKFTQKINYLKFWFISISQFNNSLSWIHRLKRDVKNIFTLKNNLKKNKLIYVRSLLEKSIKLMGKQ